MNFLLFLLFLFLLRLLGGIHLKKEEYGIRCSVLCVQWEDEGAHQDIAVPPLGLSSMSQILRCQISQG